jgi:hypothetical protein
VVLDADFISAQDIQKIAAKVGFSETAFVMKSNKADFMNDIPIQTVSTGLRDISLRNLQRF